MLSIKDCFTIEYQIFREVWNIHNKQLRNIDNIDESLSIFKGQVNIVTKIAKDVYKRLVKFNKYFDIKYSVDQFENVDFFKFIEIIGKENLNSLAGYINKTEFDSKTNQIEKIIIKLNTSEIYEYADILSLIGHEIKHAWQDYQAYINKSDLSQLVLTNNTNYSKISELLNDETVSILVNIIYRCFKHETDAFNSEFSLEISQLIKENNPTTLQDCLELFRKSKTFEDFSLLLKFLETNKEDNFTKNLINELNKKLSTNYTWDSFKKKYSKPLNKAFQRLCNAGALMFWKYTDNKKHQRDIKSLTDGGIRENRGNLAKRLKEFYL